MSIKSNIVTIKNYETWSTLMQGVDLSHWWVRDALFKCLVHNKRNDKILIKTIKKWAREWFDKSPSWEVSRTLYNQWRWQAEKIPVWTFIKFVF